MPAMKRASASATGTDTDSDTKPAAAIRISAGTTLRVHGDGAPGRWPLHDASRTREIEAGAAATRPQPPLMARAGEAVARLGRALAPHARQTVVLAGPGNNGGDGLVAARLLHSARHPVRVRMVADLGRLPPDAAQALRMASGAGVDIRPFDPLEPFDAGPHDLAVDALLGIGSRRAPDEPLAQAIRSLHAWPGVCLAVDLPSGLHPDTGALLGEQAIRADATIALLTIKPGCLTAHGRDHAGQLWWNDLGQTLAEPGAWLAGPPAPATRPHAAHKGVFGDVWVVGGAQGMAGALVLAAHAALAAGAGRVYACPVQPGAPPGLRPEVMRRLRAQAEQPETLAGATIVAGCGGGPGMTTALPALLRHGARLVLDADALNTVAASVALQDAVRARADQGLATVLTPHPLEAARLLACPVALVQADRLAAADRLARRFHAVVVLKGSGTVIAAPDALPCINPTGNAALGTAGTGDVLAGWLGGVWAQRAGEPNGAHAAHAAAQSAVWWHGQAADDWLAHGHGGALRAANLIEAMALR